MNYKCVDYLKNSTIGDTHINVNIPHLRCKRFYANVVLFFSSGEDVIKTSSPKPKNNYAKSGITK